MTFKENMQFRCENDVWPMLIILTNGIEILVSSEAIEFHEDFLAFDRIAAQVEIRSAGNSGSIPRYVMIPYSSIALFTDISS